jgi:hypothetical protein
MDIGAVDGGKRKFSTLHSVNVKMQMYQFRKRQPFQVTINCKLVLCTGRQVIQNILPSFNHLAGVELSSLGLYTLEDLLERGLDSVPQQRNNLLETELGHQSKRENVKFSRWLEVKSWIEVINRHKAGDVDDELGDSEDPLCSGQAFLRGRVGGFRHLCEGRKSQIVMLVDRGGQLSSRERTEGVVKSRGKRQRKVRGKDVVAEY